MKGVAGSMASIMERLQRVYLAIEKKESALPFNISTCSSLLTQKLVDNNTTLLQMSAIRLLFMSSHSCQCWAQLRSSLLTDAQYNIARILVDKVSETENIMFINFIASKSLVSIISHSDTSPECAGSVVESLLSKLTEHSHGMGVTYSLQTLVESLKCLRKSVSVAKRGICVTAITAWWPRYIQHLTTSSDQLSASVVDCQRTVNQELLQFVSLTVECLRSITALQAGEESSKVQLSAEMQVPCLPNEMNLFLNELVPHLMVLGEMIVKSNCSHSFVKFTDVISKCFRVLSSLNEEKRMQLFDSLGSLFTSRVLRWSTILDTALRNWFDSEGKLVYSLLMIECGRLLEEKEDKESGSFLCRSDLPPILQSASDTLLRKYLVLLLKLCTAEHLYDKGCHSLAIQSHDCISKFVGSLKELFVSMFTLLPKSLLPILVQKAIVQIVAAHDSCLVQTLTTCLKLQKLNTSGESLLNIHDLFLAFLRSIGFDHSVLLDLFISPETDFDSFLNSYLDFLASNMTQLISACDMRDSVIHKSTDTSCSSPVQASHQEQATSAEPAAEESLCSAPKVPKLSDPESENEKTEDNQEEEEEEDSSFSSVASLLFHLSESLFKLSRPDSKLVPLNKTCLAHAVHNKITSLLNEWTE